MQIPILPENKMKNKLLKLLKEKQGAALIYALCVMAVFTFICFALLFITGQVGKVTMADRRREIYYQQALTMSDVIEAELSESGSQMRAKINDYLPRVNQASEFQKRSPRSFVAEANGENPAMSIRLQNGEYTMQEKPGIWELDAVAYQYVDITVSVYDSTGVKAAVTTRYACYQESKEMKYTVIFTDNTGVQTTYPNPDYPIFTEPKNDGDIFYFYNSDPDHPNEITIQWNGVKLTLKDAKNWMGAEQKGTNGTKLQVKRIRDPETAATGDTYYEKIERR